MSGLIVVGLLLILQVSALAYLQTKNPSIVTLIPALPGFVALCALFYRSLASHYLQVYLFGQRLYLRTLGRGETSEWRIYARFQGRYSPDSLVHLVSTLQSVKRFAAKVDYAYSTKVGVSLFDRVVLTFSLDDSTGEIDIESKFLEVTFSSAEDTLNGLIGPLLECVKRDLRPEHDSYQLELRFSGNNPFYALYISHLRPEQIDRFNITIAPRGISAENLESVTITKDLVTVEAVSTSAFLELSKKFVLLRTSPALLKGTTNA